jgi:hypothetical protein
VTGGNRGIAKLVSRTPWRADLANTAYAVYATVYAMDSVNMSVCIPRWRASGGGSVRPDRLGLVLLLRVSVVHKIYICLYFSILAPLSNWSVKFTNVLYYKKLGPCKPVHYFCSLLWAALG